MLKATKLKARNVEKPPLKTAVPLIINNKLSIINRDLLIINHCIECLLCPFLPVPLLGYDVRHPDMSRVVQGKTDGEDEDDAGGDLNGQSHKVGATSYLQ